MNQVGPHARQKSTKVTQYLPRVPFLFPRQSENGARSMPFKCNIYVRRPEEMGHIAPLLVLRRVEPCHIPYVTAI